MSKKLLVKISTFLKIPKTHFFISHHSEYIFQIKGLQVNLSIFADSFEIELPIFLQI